MKDLNHIAGLLKRQDKKAVALMYDHYGSAIYGIISRIVNDPHQAEELLQDTFIRAWEKGNYYDESKGSLFTWIMRIARNLSINKVHSKAHKKKMVTGSIDHKIEPGTTELSINTLGLHGHVNDLEDRYKQVIEMIYFRGYTHKDAADYLEIPLGTLKSRVKQGLEHLRKIYHPH